MFIYSRIMRKTRKHQNRLYLDFWRAVYIPVASHEKRVNEILNSKTAFYKLIILKRKDMCPSNIRKTNILHSILTEFFQICLKNKAFNLFYSFIKCPLIYAVV